MDVCTSLDTKMSKYEIKYNSKLLSPIILNIYNVLSLKTVLHII